MRQSKFAPAFLLAIAISPATAQERPDDGSIYNGGGAYTTVVGALKGIWAKLTSGVSVTCTSGCGTPATPALSSNTPASLAVTNATARVAFADNTTTFPAANLLNDGASELFFALGNGAVTAATSNQALPAGRSICVAIGGSVDVAAITAAGTTTLTIKQASACPPESGGGGSGGGGGGAVTVADGADVTLGAKADTASCTGAQSTVSCLKQIDADIKATGTVQGTAAAGAAPSGNPLNLGANASGATGGQMATLITCDKHVFKHITSATDTLAVQGVLSQTIRICGWRSRAAGVATWFLENTASANANCSSSNTQITGVATEAANTGETMLAAFWTGLANTSGNGLCINSTGTGGVDVDIWFNQF